MDQTAGEPRLRRAVRAVILAEDDHVLLCRFSLPHPAVPTGATVVWAAPGGGIEPGELPLEALRRELLEETGLVLDADPPHRMVHVEHFNGDTTHGPTVTTTLTPEGDGTRMTVLMRYSDAAARAAAIEQGFTDGIDRVYGRIEELIFPA